LPDLPTIAESGVLGYEVNAWFGLFAPARVPSAIIGQLNAEARKAVLSPDVVRRMDAEGTEVVGNPSKEFAAEVRKEFDKWRALVKNAGLRT
jgi:tripartite-type tricarboxylate transporter receptor subunit TctC